MRTDFFITLFRFWRCRREDCLVGCFRSMDFPKPFWGLLRIKSKTERFMLSHKIFRTFSIINCALNSHDWWLGVGGRGRTLSGGQRLVTSTVAGKGIAVATPFAVFVYTGNCLQWKEKIEIQSVLKCTLERHMRTEACCEIDSIIPSSMCCCYPETRTPAIVPGGRVLKI